MRLRLEMATLGMGETFAGYPLAGCSLLGSVMPRTFSRLGVVGTKGGTRYVWSMGGRSREQLRRACLFLLVDLF